jgi:hypothetical protein
MMWGRYPHIDTSPHITDNYEMFVLLVTVIYEYLFSLKSAIIYHVQNDGPLLAEKLHSH